MPQLVKTGNEVNTDPLGELLKRLLTADPNNPMQNWTGTANMNNKGNLPGGNNTTIHGEIAQREQADNSQILFKLIDKHPGLQATYKAIKDNTTRQVTEAQAANVPDEEILKIAHEKAGIPMPSQMQPSQNPLNLLRNLVQSVVDIIPTSPDAKIANSTVSLNRQKYQGQVPLQAGERELAELNGMYKIAEELAKKGSPEALKGSDANNFNMLLEGKGATEQLAGILQENPNVLSDAVKPGWFKSQKGRQFETAMKRAFNARIRIESQGTVNEQEIDRLWKTFAVGKTDSPETIRQKVGSLADFFQRGVNIVDPEGIHRQRASGSKGAKTIGRFQVEVH